MSNPTLPIVPGWRYLGGKKRRFIYDGSTPWQLDREVEIQSPDGTKRKGKLVFGGDAIARRAYEERIVGRQKVGRAISQEATLPKGKAVEKVIQKQGKDVAGIGHVFVFDFEKNNKTGKTIPHSLEQKNFRQMDALIQSLNPNDSFQVHFLANTYGSINEHVPINEWSWASTAWQGVDTFLSHEYQESNHRMLQYFYDWHHVMPYTFPPKNGDTMLNPETDEEYIGENGEPIFFPFPEGYSPRMADKTILGFREVHIVVWHTDKLKR